MSTVLVLMSGGVDSSVAAGLLQERGHQVIGLTMRQVTGEGGVVATSGCCSYSDIRDAKRIAWALGVDHYTIDLEEAFRERVIEPFVRDYAAGRTPNPCVSCNREVRFSTAFDMAAKVGADCVATGHYVRLSKDESSGRTVLCRGVDPGKDQSYFLYGIDASDLDRMLFPLGEYTKEEVRRLAERFELPVADKPDSQDICFALEGGVHTFLESQGIGQGGEIVDTRGAVLGHHRGVAHHTVGQRQGLGLSDGPWYVVALEPESHRVVVGRREELARRRVHADRLNVLDRVQTGERLEGMIRSQMRPQPCAVSAFDGSRIAVEFDEPLYGVAPGQSLVLYRGDVVVAGGAIEGSDAG